MDESHEGNHEDGRSNNRGQARNQRQARRLEVMGGTKHHVPHDRVSKACSGWHVCDAVQMARSEPEVSMRLWRVVLVDSKSEMNHCKTMEGGAAMH